MTETCKGVDLNARMHLVFDGYPAEYSFLVLNPRALPLMTLMHRRTMSVSVEQRKV